MRDYCCEHTFRLIYIQVLPTIGFSLHDKAERVRE